MFPGSEATYMFYMWRTMLYPTDRTEFYLPLRKSRKAKWINLLA